MLIVVILAGKSKGFALRIGGMVLVDPLSTPVARALVSRALEDKVNLVTAFSGRSDAADGSVFPYVMPLSPNYWTQPA